MGREKRRNFVGGAKVYEPKVTRTCEVCGQEFQTWAAWDRKRPGGARYCCKEHKDIAARLDFNNWEKFWAKLEVNEAGCWEWPGPYQTHDPAFPYGKVHVAWREAEMVMAHRLAWELINGPIPDGLIVRHTCDNPKCCNPYHLLLGTHQDNSDDMVMRGRQANGERHALAKLREEDIPVIRGRLGRGETQQAVADDYQVRQSTISLIASGATWGYIL
jgi:hypothetical protein